MNWANLRTSQQDALRVIAALVLANGGDVTLGPWDMMAAERVTLVELPDPIGLGLRLRVFVAPKAEGASDASRDAGDASQGATRPFRASVVACEPVALKALPVPSVAGEGPADAAGSGVAGPSDPVFTPDASSSSMQRPEDGHATDAAAYALGWGYEDEHRREMELRYAGFVLERPGLQECEHGRPVCGCGECWAPGARPQLAVQPEREPETWKCERCGHVQPAAEVGYFCGRALCQDRLACDSRCSADCRCNGFAWAGWMGPYVEGHHPECTDGKLSREAVSVGGVPCRSYNAVARRVLAVDGCEHDFRARSLVCNLCGATRQAVREGAFPRGNEVSP